MNITFMKSLIISFGFHAFAISLFLMTERNSRKVKPPWPRLLSFIDRKQ